MRQSRPLSALFQLILSWLWVGLPLGWGVYQAVVRTRALFR